jgi:FkbM family methyltransferase
MEYLGTQYGGWWIPRQIALNENSVVYSGGIGEDMSFDVKLQSKYGCTVVCIDPTKRAVQHYEQLRRYFESGRSPIEFTGDIQPDYFQQINSETPDFVKMPYLNVGLWDSQCNMRFYKQDNEQYVSQSLIEGMFSDKFEEIEVNTIPNIMRELGHTHIDLLKLDIEGAELRVIEHMFSVGVKPK